MQFQQDPRSQQESKHASESTFVTGQSDDNQGLDNTQEVGLALSLDETISRLDTQMRDHEQNAEYLEAEKVRHLLLDLKQRKKERDKEVIEDMQKEDIGVFHQMVVQHQNAFDQTWLAKIEEHKARADDLIDALKWKHDEQQKQLYEKLRNKKAPKLSAELLNMRKRQVALGRSQQYLEAEKVKRSADKLELQEIEVVRQTTFKDNQNKFKSLLKVKIFRLRMNCVQCVLVCLCA